MNPSTALFLFLAATAGALMVIVVRALRRRMDRDPRPVDVAPTSIPQPTDEDRMPDPSSPPATPPAVSPLAGDPDRSLTDMLEGIELPYDLMPITSAVEDADRHIVFLTTHSNAGEVGKRFADELERLGFELESVDFDQAVAARGDDVVSMKIVPDADQVQIADSPRYGAAGRGDVALETWVGRSPTPPSSPE